MCERLQLGVEILELEPVLVAGHGGSFVLGEEVGSALGELSSKALFQTARLERRYAASPELPP